MFEKQFKKRIQAIYQANYTVIEVESGDNLMNNQCHFNAVYHHQQNNNLSVCLVMTDGSSLHFVNYDEKLNKYIDYTLGSIAKDIRYRLIRKISPLEYKNAEDLKYNVFINAINYFNNQVPLFIRLFSKWEVS